MKTVEDLDSTATVIGLLQEARDDLRSRNEVGNANKVDEAIWTIDRVLLGGGG